MNSSEQVMTGVLLGGKSSKELDFPDAWEYDFNRCAWKSEKYKMTTTHMGSNIEGDTRKVGETRDIYMWITDEMLAKTKKIDTTKRRTK